MMREMMVQIFGTYTTVDGCANWEYIGGVLIFAISLYSLFRFVGMVFKK